MALGYLVGALVVGTASPHLLRDWFSTQPWEYVMYSTSLLALIGGLAIGVGVPDGPFRKATRNVDFSSFYRVFTHKKLKAAAIGYFGHMWELYAFWAFIPAYITLYNKINQANISVSLTSFYVIGVGGLACVLGGYMSFRQGSARVAFSALSVSMICCILSPLVFIVPKFLFLLFLVIWGMAVITDSPQFSTLVAQSAPAESVGTALTIVNSIGFAITIFSIQLLSSFVDQEWLFIMLVPGPLFGLFVFYREHIRY